MRRSFGLTLASLAFAVGGLEGCAGAIQSLAHSDGQSVSNRPPQRSIPTPSSQAYESPIPKWNSAHKDVTGPQLGPRGLTRAHRMLDVVDAVNGVLAEIGPGGRSVNLTPLAITFCMSGMPQRREKDWWGNVYSLQPGGLASSIFEGRLKDKCELSYRRSH